jgi:hypothetical protein
MKGNLQEYIEMDKGLISNEQLKDKIVWTIETNQEREFLDFKSTYTDTQLHKLELVRDIVAMANTEGGYIVLGVNELSDAPLGFRWHPNGLSDEDITKLTTENVRGVLANYLQIIPDIVIDYTKETFPLGKYKDVKIGIIYIEASKDLILISNNGDYQESILVKGQRRMEQKQLFRAGDIFVRKGPRTERISSAEDWNRIKSRWRKSEMTEWQEEYLEIKQLNGRIEELINILRNIFMKSGVRSTETQNVHEGEELFDRGICSMGPKGFEERSLMWIREDDEFSIRMFLEESPKSFFRVIQNEPEQDIERARDTTLIPLLNNVTIFGIQLIRFEKNEYLQLVRKSLYKIYQQSEKIVSRSIQGHGISKCWAWKELLKRIFVLGAYSLERKHYKAAKIFIDQPIEDMQADTVWRNHLWMRHGLVMLARANQFQERSLCKIGVDFVKGNEYFCDLFEKNDDKIIEFCCQFDFLQCLVVRVRTNDFQAPYPSFGIYQNNRTTPMINLVINDVSIRKEFVDIDDKKLAEIILELDKAANKEYRLFSGWVSDFMPEQIKQFIRENLTE